MKQANCQGFRSYEGMSGWRWVALEGLDIRVVFMNQCLRCSKPCAATSVFCDGCRALLRNQLQRSERTGSEGGAFSSSSIGTSPIVATITEQGDAYVYGGPLERITSPHSIVKDP